MTKPILMLSLILLKVFIFLSIRYHWSNYWNSLLILWIV